MYNITRFISDSHIGIRTTDGKCDIIIPPLYKMVVILRPGLYLALNDDNKWGILNDKNQVVISFEFEYIEPLEFGNFFAAKKNDSLSLFSLSGQLVSGEEFEKLESLGPGLFLFAKHGLYGALDKNGHIILPCDFESIRLVCHGRFLIASCRGQMRCFNREGDEIPSKPRRDFEVCKAYYSHIPEYLRTTEKGLSGLAYAVDEDLCIEIIPCQYHSIGKYTVLKSHLGPNTEERNQIIDHGFCDNFLLVSTKIGQTRLYGFIDWDNCIRIPLVFEDAEAFCWMNYTSVKLNGKWGIIDRQGRWMTLPKWDSIRQINEYGLCLVSELGKYSVYRVTGEEVLPFSGDGVIKPFFALGGEAQFGPDTCLVGKQGPYSKLGDRVLDDSLKGAFLFGDAGKVGLYSKRGKTLIEPNYSYIQYAGEGICAVCQGDRWGYYDLMNGEVLPCQYLHIDVFISGLSCVHLEFKQNLPYSRSFVVDRDGNIRLQADRIIRLTEHLFWVENNNHGTIVNSMWETIFEYPIPEDYRQFKFRVIGNHCFIGDFKSLWVIDTFGDYLIGAKQLLHDSEGYALLSFKNGLAKLWVDGGENYMDVDGNLAPFS